MIEISPEFAEFEEGEKICEDRIEDIEYLGSL